MLLEIIIYSRVAIVLPFDSSSINDASYLL